MRNPSTTMQAALSAQWLTPAIFVSMRFLNATIYVWSGAGPITWNGQAWAGIGSFLGFSPIEDGAGPEPKGIQVMLSGFDSALLSEVMTEFGLELPVSVFFGLFDATHTIIADPLCAWGGRTDKPVIRVDGSTATITVNCENKLISLNVPCSRRHTQEDQQMLLAELRVAGDSRAGSSGSDDGFNWVNGLQEQNLLWGNYPVTGRNI